MGSRFICPSCKKEGLCSCDRCRSQKEEGLKFVELNEETIECPYCGHYFSYDQALEEEIKILNDELGN